MSTGKMVYEDISKPHSTDIVCELCGSPWNGLVMTNEGTFRHRLPCKRSTK